MARRCFGALAQRWGLVGAATALAVAAAGQPAAAAELAGRELNVATGDWPPYLGEDLDGGGPVARVVTRAFARQDVAITYNYYPWVRAKALAERGEVDGTIVWARTQERQQTFRFAGPIFEAATTAFARKDRELDVRRRADLDGLVVGGVMGYDYGPLEAAGGEVSFELRRSGSLKAAFRKLAKGWVDIVPMDRNVGRYTLEELKLTHVIAPAGAVLAKKYYFMLARDHPDSAAIAEALEAGLKSLRADGTYGKLLGDLTLVSGDG